MIEYGSLIKVIDVSTEKVLRIINIILDSPLIQEHIDSDLSTLGIDSITFIRLIVALEEAFEVEIPDEYLLMTQLNTVRKIQQVLSDLINPSAK